MIRIKYAFSGIKKHKGKFILIFLATLLTMLLYNVTSSFQESIVSTRLNQVRELSNNTQIVIVSKDENSVLFDSNEIEDIVNIPEVNDYIQGLSLQCTFDNNNEYIYLNGMDVTKRNKLCEIRLRQGDIEHLSNQDVIVSEKFADNYNYKLNDEIEINKQDVHNKFVIKAIAENDGLFRDPMSLITTLDAARALGGFKEGVSYVEVSLNDLEQMENVQQLLQERLKDTKLRSVLKFDLNYFHSYVSTVTLALNIFSIFLTCFTIFILYSIYKSYVYESMGELATLRSIGFSISECKEILLIQIGIILVVSFILVIFLTPVSIKLLGSMLFQQMVDVKLNVVEIMLKFIGIVIISIGIVLIAIAKITKINIVSMIKNENIKVLTNRVNRKDYIVNVIFLLFIFGTKCVGYYWNSMVISYALLIEFIIYMILVQKILLYWYGKLIQVIFGNSTYSLGLFGKQIGAALRNYKQAITAVVFVISLAMILTSTTSMMQKAMNQIYEDTDILVTVYDTKVNEVQEALDSEDTVTNYVILEQFQAFIGEQPVKLSGIEVDAYDDKDFSMILHKGNQKLFQKIKEGNTIIITETLARKLEVDREDILTINNQDLRVVDIVRSFEDRGEVCYLSTESFNKLEPSNTICNVLVNTDIEEEECVKLLQDKLKGMNGLYIAPITDILKQNIESNQIIINAVLLLTCLIVIISLVSLFSVVQIDLLSRIREFFIYRTVGISKKELIRVALYESISISIYAILFGTIMELIVLPEIADILSYYVGSIDVVITSQNIVISFVLSLAFITGIMVITTWKQCLKKESVRCL